MTNVGRMLILKNIYIFISFVIKPFLKSSIMESGLNIIVVAHIDAMLNLVAIYMLRHICRERM